MQKIAGVDELPNGASKKFSFLKNSTPTEGFLIRYEDRFYAYENECAHQQVSLDMEDNDFFSVDGKTLICKMHGAQYEPHTGKCLGAPCLPGSCLNSLDLVVEDQTIYLSF